MSPAKPRHRHAPLVHDMDLLNSLILLWLGVVIAGFALNAGVEYYYGHTFFPSLSFSFAPMTDSSEWTHLESHGDLELMYRTIAPTLGLHAHRAVAVADIPIEALLHVFRDTPNNPRWMKDLKEADEHHKSGAHHLRGDSQTTQSQTSTVRQRFNVPLPGVVDREMIMTKEMTAVEKSDGTHSSVTYDFTSLPEEKADVPLCTGCVRATNLGSKWTFTALNEGETKIEVEVAVDPKMPKRSTFFVNLLQKRWPQVSLHGLMREARHHLGRDGDVQVANAFFRLFPLKT